LALSPPSAFLVPWLCWSAIFCPYCNSYG
jgi:hypothetical protein